VRKLIFLAVQKNHHYPVPKPLFWSTVHTAAMCTQFACFFHFSPAKDLAPFSIHPHKKPFKPINDQLAYAEYSYISKCSISAGSAIITVLSLIRSSTNAFIMVALCNRADHYIFALWFLSIYLLSFFYSSPNLSGRTWMSTILLHMVWP